MLGVDILRKAEGISPLARAVVRSHHERWDGTGYPENRSGEDIHQFARIASVADVYDALTSDRDYRPAWSMPDGYDFVVTRGGKDFDLEAVAAFQECVAPYPPGTWVLLSDGSAGLVKEVRQGFVKTPVVRVLRDPAGAMIEPREIDLATTPGLSITSTKVDQLAVQAV
jgi:HD-GYP domain-containing protein (c-di-GMP phosphodiesterase class II)